MKYQAILLTALIGAGIAAMQAQETSPPAIFTAAQAEAGRIAYGETCGKCHTPGMLGRKGDAGEMPPIGSLSDYYQKFIGPRGYVPPLAGPVFMDRWGSKTAAQLIARFQETASFFSPEDKDDQTVVNITAWVLQVNGAKAGTQALTRSTNVVVSSTTHGFH